MTSVPQPRISVIIPTYDRCELLRDGLAALARQRLPRDEFEVVVSDDGSTDGTRQVVEDFRDTLRLKYHFQPDLGFRVSAARNAGARLAEAPVLVLLDTGALVGPHFLEEHLAAHEDGAGARAVVGYAYAYRPEDPTPGLAEALSRMEPEDVVAFYGDDPRFRDNRHPEFARCGFDLNRRAVPWMFLWATNASVRAADYWAVGGFDEDFRRWGVEDMEFGLRLFRHGLRFHLTRSAWVVEAPHPRDMTANWADNELNIAQFHDKYPEPLAEIGWALITSSPEDYWRWEDDYRQLLAEEAGQVGDEILGAVRDLPAGARVAVFGSGADVPPGLPPGTMLVDFDSAALRAAATSGPWRTHHGIGMRTPLADRCTDLVVLTSRLAGLWPRWGDRILAEAGRVGARVAAPPGLLAGAGGIRTAAPGEARS